MVPDFTGYVTKYGIKCSDGRTIRAHAFAHEDGAQIPLVWQHQHKEATNVLGHLILQHREDGVYAQGFFNDTEQGQNGKALVKHKDVKNLSIYANALQQNGSIVTHGNLVEGSLVLSGANPGALIDNVNIQHGDGDWVDSPDEVVIYTDDELVHASTNVTGAKKVSMPKPAAPKAGMDMEKGKMPTPTADNPDPDGDGDNDLFDPADGGLGPDATVQLSLIHISEPTRLGMISYAVFCLKKKKKK